MFHSSEKECNCPETNPINSHQLTQHQKPARSLVVQLHQHLELHNCIMEQFCQAYYLDGFKTVKNIYQLERNIKKFQCNKQMKRKFCLIILKFYENYEETVQLKINTVATLALHFWHWQTILFVISTNIRKSGLPEHIKSCGLPISLPKAKH